MTDLDASQQHSNEVPAIARQSQLLIEGVNDELVVYDLDRGLVHLLNPVATFVWRHCDGRTTVAQLAALLRDELELPGNDDVVLLALDDLERNHLLEETAFTSTTPKSFSRRRAIKRLAATTGIGLIFPLVESLNPPSANAAASPAPSLNPCIKKCKNSPPPGVGCTTPGSEPCTDPCKCLKITFKYLPDKSETCRCIHGALPGSECGYRDAQGNPVCNGGCPKGSNCETETTPNGSFIGCFCVPI